MRHTPGIRGGQKSVRMTKGNPYGGKRPRGHLGGNAETDYWGPSCCCNISCSETKTICCSDSWWGLGSTV